MWFLALYIFWRLFWRACKTLVKHPQGFDLTHCGLLAPYAYTHLSQVNIESGTDLLPDGTKPLPKSMLTVNQ